AGQLYGLRFGLYRSGGENFAALGESLWAKSVTHVLGTICYLCVRSGHKGNGRRGRTRTCDPLLRRQNWLKSGSSLFSTRCKQRSCRELFERCGPMLKLGALAATKSST